MRDRWPGFLLLFCILAIWQWGSSVGYFDAVAFPPVTIIAQAWLTSVLNGELPGQLLPTIGRIAGGIAIATGAAVPLGLMMGTVRIVHRLLEPLVEFVRPIPSSAYIPVAILFLGIGNPMKLFVVSLACFFPILLNTYSGVRGIDRILIDTGRTFGASRLRIIRQIILPAVLPNILTGIQISLGISLVVAVVAEMISGNNGIGYFILNMQRIFQVPEMFAGIFTLGILGYLVNTGFLQAERFLLRWRVSPY
jgi:ABC-type nitrate/sulfonate/bicarbonate transport system permease component